MDTGDLDPAMSKNDDQAGGPEDTDADLDITPAPGKGDELEDLLREELGPGLEIVRRLGRGSMANVYLAREQQLKRLVAVKVLSPKLARDKSARKRFEREAQAVAALSHPNIVAVHTVGRLSNDLPYIIMQYVKGRTMEERLQAEGPLPMDEARGVIVAVASALSAAHRKGIVHRDIRPDNVLYEEDSGRALLSDFGIAAVLASGEAGQQSRITRTGELIGDPAHMSPEQLSGAEITQLSDVYALGLLGYELLTGRGPYDAKSRRELITAHVQAEPIELAMLRSDVDPEVAALLKRCLAKEPEHRPNSADVARRLKMPGAATPMPPISHPAPTGFVSRLAERRMPQILVAYAAGSWVVLQFSWQLVESAVLPRVIYQLALVAVATGFPAVLTGAWFHGKKGKQEFEAVEYWVFGGLALVWLVVSALFLIKWLSA
jgi:serine/threonine-protein kinase